jgi:hypothetical protein
MNTPNQPANQRSRPRLPAPSNVWLRCRRATDDAAELANGLLDLSEGGMQFLSREPLATGEPLAVTLAGATRHGSIRRRGKVRWVAELGGGACCAGVCFDEPLTADDVLGLLPEESAAAATDRFFFDDV